MVWPAQARRGDFPGVSRSYTAAADAVSALLLPAGDAWREAWQLDARIALYGADGFHASLLGSQLAAIVIFEGVTGQPAATLPFDLLASQASVLQQAAARVRYGRGDEPQIDRICGISSAHLCISDRASVDLRPCSSAPAAPFWAENRRSGHRRPSVARRRPQVKRLICGTGSP